MKQDKLSRRGFFSKFSDDLSDQFDWSAMKTFAARITEKSDESNHWIEIARFSEFAPNTEIIKSVENIDLYFGSDSFGIWASRSNGERVALRMGSGGTLWANLSSTWPEHRYLSHATGEPTDKENEEIKYE